MSPAESSIVTSMLITGLSVTTGTIARHHRPTLKPLLGVGVVGFVLLAIAQDDKAAELAQRMGTLIATTAVLTSGYYAAQGVGHYFGK